MDCSIINKKYRIESSIGKGGMGEVYRATDLRSNTLCALKTMHAKLCRGQEGERLRLRFMLEAQLLMQLAHDGLPKVYDFFVLGDSCYLAMDCIEGKSLLDILRHSGNPGLSETFVLEAALMVLEVIEYLHSHTPQVVHRDIKPSNLILRDSDDRIFLVDFGIAKSSTVALTTGGGGLGTVGYTPPEQWRGESEPRSDLYALGATMHHLLSGIAPLVPFEFPTISTISLRMNNVLKKALQKVPDARYANAAEMRDALRTRKPVVPPREKLPVENGAGPPSPACGSKPYAEGLTPSDKQIAKEVLELADSGSWAKAETAVVEIASECLRDETLAKLIMRASSSCAWAVAERMCVKVAAVSNRDSTIRSVTELAANSGAWSTAELLAVKIEDPAIYDGVLMKLARDAASSGSWSTAERAAAAICSTDVRDSALESVKRTAAAACTWATAERLASKIEDPVMRDGALRDLVIESSRALAWSTAERTAVRIDNPRLRDATLQELARNAAASGAWSTAERMAAFVQDPPLRAKSLRELSQSARESGALSTAERALRMLSP